GGDLPVLDLQTVEQLCQPTLNGRGGPISSIVIQATNFGLKNDMIQQVQNSCQFHGLSGDDANKHLDKCLHVTQIIKVNGVTDDALHLYLFPHSLTHHVTAWFDRLLRNSITTFEQMAKMFLGKYFPPSMVTKLRNEITYFCQRPDESLFEAWEHYKLLIDHCPNNDMLPVTQIDTFYNGLTLRHRDTINAAVGVTFMKRRLKECYDLIENMAAHHNDWDTSAQRSESSSSITSSFDLKNIALKAEMAKINKNLVKVLQINQLVKAVTLSCETCGGPHAYNDCQATVGQNPNVYAAGAYNQCGTLPSNTITNPKVDLKGITTRSGIAYKGPTIPTTSSHPKSLLTNKEKLFELVRTPLNEHCSAILLKKLPENLRDPSKFLIPCDFLRMDECLALADLGANTILMPLSVWKKLSLPELSPTCMTLELADRPISPVTFNLDQTLRYSSNYDAESINRIDVIDVACEEYSQEILGFLVSGNPTPSTKPIVSTSSPTLSPFEDSDFLLEETDAFLAIEDELISSKIDDSYYDSKGDILLLVEFLNDDPSSPPLPLQELKGEDKLPIIIAKDLKNEEKTALINVLKSHKQALAWQLSDIKGINSEFYTHKILMEDDFKPTVQHQRRVNPKIHEVIKKEVIKLLDAELIYPILDSPWEKSHFMVKEGIVLGHKISKNGIEVDKAKVDVIAKLPHPTTVKGVRSFLGHASFYRRFIQDLSKIAWPMTRLLEKDTPFGTPRAIISDRDTYFCNHQFAKVRLKYGVNHRLATMYHPQTNGQVEVSNHGLKRILERTVGENHASWSDKLDDALWYFFVQLSKHPSGVLLTSSCMERHAIYRSNSSTKPTGP
nr:reverse transcriptase domain-containing protein [Tanacetum cinerariifolium]